jgi:Leucine rich repeat/Leucine Rich Repeat
MIFFDIRNNHLQGTIPDWLGDNWINLEVLTLAENQMNGPLPTSIQKLSNLKTLSLAHNLFESSLEYISGLQNLEYLYLQKNHFTGSVDDTFLDGSSSLIQMDLSSNELTSSHLPSHLFSFPNLKVLHLGDNSLMGILPDPFGKNTRLEFLSLSDNILTGPIPDSISELSSLKHLDLTDNQITGNIPVSLISMTSINYLFLSENNFDPGPIPDFLSSMTQLRELSLSLTRRTGTLPGKWLGSLPNLVLLDFSFNDLNGTLPSVLWEHPQLHFLLLNRNQFSGSLPSGISDTQLQLLALDKNNITGDFSEVCTLNAVNVFTDCGEIICNCCTCCEDENPKCNDDLLYSNEDFSWDYDYQRNYYAFSPLILINSTIEP